MATVLFELQKQTTHGQVNKMDYRFSCFEDFFTDYLPHLVQKKFFLLDFISDLKFFQYACMLVQTMQGFDETVTYIACGYGINILCTSRYSELESSDWKNS